MDIFEFNIPGCPFVQKSGTKRTDSRAGVNQTAMAMAVWGEQSRHESRNGCRCEKLAQLGFFLRVGCFGYGQPRLFDI